MSPTRTRRARPLLHVGGVPLRADASLWIIGLLAVWLFWSLFASRWGDLAAVPMAVVAAALFFGSIAAHECAHALEALRRGMKVADITLYVFGGATRLLTEPATWSDELALTLVGPATSLLLGGAFLVLTVAASAVGFAAVAEVTGQLGWLNLLLGLFNLLPGAPLDGGRVVDALVWRSTGDRHRAALTATRAGQLLGAALIALGLLEALLVLGGLVGGLWLALIGWFLHRSATTERRVAQIRAALARRTVADIVAPVATVGSGSSVAQAIDTAWRFGRTDIVAVMAHDALLGAADGAALARVPAAHRPWVPVDQLMVPAEQLRVAQRTTPADELVRLLADVPVVAVYDNGSFLTLVTADQVVAASRWFSTPGAPGRP